MKLKVLIFALLIVPSSGGAAASDADWTGLWSLTLQTTNGPQHFALFVPGSSGTPTFYGPDWSELILSDVSTQGKDLLLNWQTKGTNVVFKGVRQGDRITGQWELLHPQFHQEGSFSARRAFAASHWSPLASAPSGAVADLNSKLAGQSGDLDHYWNQTFKPHYWTLLESDADLAEVRQRILGADFASRSAELTAELEEICSELSVKLDGFKLPSTVVLLPFGKPDQFRLVFVQDKSFLLLNPVRFLSNPKTSRLDLAREALSALMNAQFEGRHAALDLTRAGMVGFALRKLGYATDESQAVGLSTAEWTATRGRLAEIKKKIAGNRPLTSAETAVAGLDFVAYLAGNRSFPQLYAIPTAELAKQMREYAAGG